MVREKCQKFAVRNVAWPMERAWGWATFHVKSGFPMRRLPFSPINKGARCRSPAGRHPWCSPIHSLPRSSPRSHRRWPPFPRPLRPTLARSSSNRNSPFPTSQSRTSFRPSREEHILLVGPSINAELQGSLLQAVGIAVFPLCVSVLVSGVTGSDGSSYLQRLGLLAPWMLLQGHQVPGRVDHSRALVVA